MATPFFSIDMAAGAWAAYLRGVANHPEWFSTKRRDLEGYLQKRFPARHVILLPSARLGFYLLLQSAFRPGDEVIFSTLSFPLYIKIALQIGIKPVLIDVEPEHLNMDPNELRKAITSETKGIVVTHLFGHPAEMSEIVKISSEWNVPVVEDCAQSYDSFYNDKETGTFGAAGIFSCSLMKAPTTLGGGVLVTKDYGLFRKIKTMICQQDGHLGMFSQMMYHLKGLVSMINSYPLPYTLLSHHVFGLIKKRNPALLRAILYAGMGMDGKTFNPSERPQLAPYQLEVGAVQFNRAREMTVLRRKNSMVLDSAMELHKDAILFKESKKSYWNYQYHVVDFGSRMNEVFDKAFKQGIHVMKEDVWDCTNYKLQGVEVRSHRVATSRNKGLLRIPNNSFLSDQRIERIAATLLGILD